MEKKMKDILIDYYEDYLESLQAEQIPFSKEVFVQKLQDIILYDIFEAVQSIADDTDYEDSEEEE